MPGLFVVVSFLLTTRCSHTFQPLHVHVRVQLYHPLLVVAAGFEPRRGGLGGRKDSWIASGSGLCEILSLRRSVRVSVTGAGPIT